MLKEGKKEKIIGIVILLLVIVAVIVLKNLNFKDKEDKKLTVVYGV